MRSTRARIVVAAAAAFVAITAAIAAASGVTTGADFLERWVAVAVIGGMWAVAAGMSGAAIVAIMWPDLSLSARRWLHRHDA